MVATLLLVLTTLVILEASQPLHLHEADNAGLYNEDHVLASADSIRGDLPLPDIRGVAFVALVAGACLTARGTPRAAPALDLTDSRAPPPA
jgi:uncharacterized membrane protein